MNLYAVLAHRFATIAILCVALALAVGVGVAIALHTTYVRRDLRARRTDPLAPARAIRAGRR